MRFLKVAQDKVNKAIGEKQVFIRELVVGDRVIHTTSGVRGVLEGVEICGGRVLLTIRTPAGQVLRKLARQEFRLCGDASATEFVAAHVAPTVAPSVASNVAAASEKVPAVAEPELDLKMDCSEGISTESILDEL